MTSPVPSGPIEAVLLDLDGTLIETDNRWAMSLARRLDSLRKVIPGLDTESLARSIVMSIEMPANYVVTVIEHLGLTGVIAGLSNRLRKSKGLATEGAAELVEGSEELIQRLSQRYKLGVVTTRARKQAFDFIQSAGFEPYMQVIVTRQDVFRMKPHPEPVCRAAQLLGVAPDRCVMVGDTTMDMRAARRAGAYAVGVLSGFGTRKELERAGAQLILERALELLEHLPDPSR